MHEHSPMTEMFAREDRLAGSPQMIIMVGFSRTGKSTFVNKMVRHGAAKMGRAFTIVSGDDVRRALGVRYDSRLEDQVKAALLLMANAIMQRRQHLVVDETNLTVVERQRWVDLAEAMGYTWTIAEVECLDEEVHRRECKKHDYAWAVIEKQKARYQPVLGEQRLRYTFIRKDQDERDGK